MLAFGVQAQVENLVVSGTVSQDTVSFRIENSGSIDVTASFIVIQDQVLPLTQGEITIAPNQDSTIKVFSNAAQNHDYILELTDELGLRSSDSKKTFVLRGTRSNLNEQVAIYPNPLSSSCTIDLPINSSANYDLALFDATGNQVFKQKAIAAGKFTLERGNLPSGVYVVQIVGKDFSEQRKLIFK